jgi:DNA-binding MarR family transcriptional regulator
LNISATQINSLKAIPSAKRRKLHQALLDELTSWNPREFIAMFRRLKHGSVSLIHLNVLTVLDFDGAMSMGHLAEALDVSVASMTGIVDRMEKRGLVERRHDEQDRRVVLVQPTQAGKAVFTVIGEQRRFGLGKILDQLSDDELAALLQGHRALRLARSAIAARLEAPAEPRK